MNAKEIPFEQIATAPDLERSSRSKVFEEHLTASISEVGLAEPIKVADRGNSRFVVIDGVMRLRAIAAVRDSDPDRFRTVPAYVFPFEARYEIRFQTDIYQDLRPSQLASLVEHLHENTHISKKDIARYIGISSATLRNYTGLWRLIQRGGLFARIVDLMDHGVLPASNPYAWLRLTAVGLKHAIETSFSDGEKAEAWIAKQMETQPHEAVRFPIKYVEAATDSLLSDHYRQNQDVRDLKRGLGLRRAASKVPPTRKHSGAASKNLARVISETSDPVIRSAARSLKDFVG